VIDAAKHQNDVDAVLLALRQPGAPAFDGADDPAWTWAIREGEKLQAEIRAAGGLEAWRARQGGG
jgi:hypothetical protein